MNLKKYFKHIIIIFSTLLLVVSCSEKAEEINKEKFVLIITDLHKANALFSNKGLMDIKLKEKNASYYNYIFKKYNITRATFESTLEYYSENLLDYINLYEEVVKNLNEEEITFIDPAINMFDIHILVLDSISRKKVGEFENEGI